MLDPKISWIDPKTIVVNLEERQRQMELDCSDLIPSIRRRGIDNPLIVDKVDMTIIAGWRRLTSALFLEMDKVPVRFTRNGITARERTIIEFEENARRKDLTWQDNAKAFWQIHRMFSEERFGGDPDWTAEQTASYMGYSERHAYRMIDLGEAIHDGDENVKNADTIANATTLLTRRRDRQKSDALNAIMELGKKPSATAGSALLGALTGGAKSTGGQASGPTGDQLPDRGVSEGAVDRELPDEPAPPHVVLHADAHKFLDAYDGPRFNLLHCDLPYGVKLNAQAGQAGFEGGGYDSDPDIYWALCRSITEHWDKFMFPSSHVVFWISMKFYTETIDFFTKHGPADLKINPTPLIWHKTDNKGIISDAQRGPRNIYEAALLMSTGDRHIVRPVSNVYGCPTAKGAEAIHTNEKPEPMLRYFLGMLVDERSRVFDPTTGSGTSIRASEGLGAEASLGLEFNPEFADRAQKKLIQARSLRSLHATVAAATGVDSNPSED